MAPSALQAAIMAEAIERGCATYDLYGIDVQGDQANHAYRRLSQFKRRFGGANRVYIGAHDLYGYDRIADAMLPLPATPGGRGGTRFSVRALIFHTTFDTADLMAAGSISRPEEERSFRQ